MKPTVETISTLKQVSERVEGVRPKTLADLSQTPKDAMTKVGFKIDWGKLQNKDKAEADDSDDGIRHRVILFADLNLYAFAPIR